MNDRLERFHQDAANLGPRRAGRKFPKPLMALGAEHAMQRRAAGASWQAVADELGIGVLTVRRWCERIPAAAAAFERVTVVEEQRPFTASIGPLRIEGLDFDALVALARALS